MVSGRGIDPAWEHLNDMDVPFEMCWIASVVELTYPTSICGDGGSCALLQY